MPAPAPCCGATPPAAAARTSLDHGRSAAVQAHRSSSPRPTSVFHQDRLDADWDLRIRDGDCLTVEGSILFVLRVNGVFDCVAASLLTALCGVPDRFCLIPTGTAQFASPCGSMCRTRRT